MVETVYKGNIPSSADDLPAKPVIDITAIDIKNALDTPNSIVDFMCKLDALGIDYDRSRVIPLCQRMKKVIRWGRYTDGKGNVPDDGNGLTHSNTQHDLVKIYGSQDRESEGIELSQEELERLQLACLLHDVGEIGEGDNTYDQKGDSNAEMECGIRILRETFEGSKDLNKILAAYRVDFDKNDKLYPLFKIYEKFSYITGAINAFRAQNPNDPIENMPWLVHNVYKNQIIPLMKLYLEGNMLSVIHFFEDNMDVLEEMANFIINLDFKDPEDVGNDEKFVEAKEFAKIYLALNNIDEMVISYTLILPYTINNNAQGLFSSKLIDYLPSLLQVTNYPNIKEYLIFIHNQVTGIFKLLQTSEHANNQDLQAVYESWNNFLKNKCTDDELA